MVWTLYFIVIRINDCLMVVNARIAWLINVVRMSSIFPSEEYERWLWRRSLQDWQLAEDIIESIGPTISRTTQCMPHLLRSLCLCIRVLIVACTIGLCIC